MQTFYAAVLLTLGVITFSSSALANTMPVSPVSSQEDVVVVFDDDFIQQQRSK